MRSRLAVLCGSLVALNAVLTRPVAGDVIDRILAVVNGSVITLSDVEGARRFGLIASEPADMRTAVERLIDRRLALVEVERYAPPEPPGARIDEAVAAARANFPSEAAFASALAETGMTADQLRRHVRDDLRLRTYEQQRFGFAVAPTEEEALAYFRANPDRFARGGTRPAYDDVRAEVRAAMIAEKRAASVREWIDTLRRRADVSILPM
jgi:parvulin-like peptidyl-prolyl isomerase